MIKQFTFETHTFSVFQKPKSDQYPCGDSYWLKETDVEMIGVIADGLGSGTEAQAASRAAIETVQRYEELPIAEIVQRVNKEQAKYRGVVLSILKFNKRTNTLHYCGVGNVSLKLVMNLSRVSQPHSKNGFLSGRPIEVEVHEIQIDPKAWMIMYSDGIDFNVRELYNLYGLFTNFSDEEINQYLKTTAKHHLNHDDVTILIGKPQ